MQVCIYLVGTVFYGGGADYSLYIRGDRDSTFQLLSKSLDCVKLSNLDYPLMPYGPKTRLTAPTIQNVIIPSLPQHVDL